MVSISCYCRTGSHAPTAMRRDILLIANAKLEGLGQKNPQQTVFEDVMKGNKLVTQKHLDPKKRHRLIPALRYLLGLDNSRQN